MQLALIALMLGGIFEFYPRLRVAFLEAQSWWVPGLLGRIEWDLRQHHDADAPYLKLTPLEYWQRNCFSAIESGEREVGSVVELLGRRRQHLRVERLPAFRLELPGGLDRVLTNPSITREIAAQDPVRRGAALRLRRGRLRQGRRRRHAARQPGRARLGASVPVIASAAKQSRRYRDSAGRDCFVAPLLAMTIDLGIWGSSMATVTAEGAVPDFLRDGSAGQL